MGFNVGYQQGIRHGEAMAQQAHHYHNKFEEKKGVLVPHETDPNLSKIKLDEDFTLILNNSDPIKKIVNLPMPHNDEEADNLKNYLEKMDAPKFIIDYIRPINHVPIVPVHVGPVHPMPMVPVPASPGIVVSAPHVPAVHVPPPVVPAVPVVSAPAAPVVNLVPGVAPANPNTVYLTYDDWSVDSILVNAYTSLPGMSSELFNHRHL